MDKNLIYLALDTNMSCLIFVQMTKAWFTLDNFKLYESELLNIIKTKGTITVVLLKFRFVDIST